MHVIVPGSVCHMCTLRLDNAKYKKDFEGKSIALQVLTHDEVALLADAKIGTGSATSIIFDRHGEF